MNKILEVAKNKGFENHICFEINCLMEYSDILKIDFMKMEFMRSTGSWQFIGNNIEGPINIYKDSRNKYLGYIWYEIFSLTVYAKIIGTKAPLLPDR